MAWLSPSQAGGSANDYCSLYLSCEPSPDEYEDPPGLVPVGSNANANAGLGRWTREGTYQFKFVINGPDGKTVCVKEAGEWDLTTG